MSAPVSGKFQDHYLVLGIEAFADSEAIGAAYSALSKRFHPKNAETGDEEKFKAVTLAYEVLADPAARKTFDEVRTGSSGKEAPPAFAGPEFFKMLELEVLRRKAILCLLYDRRRQFPLRPSLSLKQIESLMSSPFEELQFSIWYLKQKGYAASDDKSNTQITVVGMDYLDEHMPSPDSILVMLKGSAPVPTVPPAARRVEPVGAVEAHNPTASVLSLAQEVNAVPPVEREAAPVEASPDPAVAVAPGAKAPAGNAGTPVAAVRGSLNIPKRTIVIPARGN